MDYAKLKTELALPAYAAMTDAEAADALNAKTITKLRKVDYSDVLGYLTYAQKIVGIVQATTPAAVEIKYLATELNSFDLNSPATAASVNRLLDALITDGLISVPDKQNIIGMANYKISRAEGLGYPELNIGDIQNGRA